jgi:hypothetical protein
LHESLLWGLLTKSNTMKVTTKIPDNLATTIKFKTDKATDWYVTKEFADDKHMRNFIAYVCRTKKGYTLDEVFINQLNN